jgi:hypothetical protein
METQLGVSKKTISRDLSDLLTVSKSKPAKTASNPKGAPPFTPELVRAMIVAASHGPKGRVAQIEVDDWQIHKLVGVLNNRAAMFAATLADEDRARRRDRAAVLVGELKALLPQIASDTERWTEFFGRQTARAAKELRDVLLSDLPRRALPPVDLPTSGEGWRWTAPSLYADLKDLLGANSALRFVCAVLPRLCNEKPAAPTVKAFLRHRVIRSIKTILQ